MNFEGFLNFDLIVQATPPLPVVYRCRIFLMRIVAHCLTGMFMFTLICLAGGGGHHTAGQHRPPALGAGQRRSAAYKLHVTLYKLQAASCELK